MAAFKDLSGLKFGRLTVVCREKDNVNGRATWLCKCDCGKETTVTSSKLISGHTQSCGCLSRDLLIARQTKYLIKPKKLYSIWRCINNRCYMKNSLSYKNYGGRGIFVCEEWRNDFRPFYEWAMGSGYQDNLTIDRINNDGPYSPDNCRWADKKTQCNNKRSNHIIVYCGDSLTIAEWSEKTGLPRTTIATRLFRGWSEEEAIKIPYRTRKSTYYKNNKGKG